MTLPSFFAASISAGVTGSAGGAAASTRVANVAPPSAAVPCNNLRRDRLGIVVSLKRFLFAPLYVYRHSGAERSEEPGIHNLDSLSPARSRNSTCSRVYGFGLAPSARPGMTLSYQHAAPLRRQ